ncbi:MAG: acyl-CoA dehydrogenase family protein [bacterium]|nr:acyl-CoA dehydrogenase family protein [bacterium]
MADKEISITKGGSFLIEPTGSCRVFTADDFNEEQKMISKTASDFMEKEVFTIVEKIEHKQPGLIPSLLKKAGELGLLMIDIPKKYDGLGESKATSMLVSEKMHQMGSMAVSLGAHTGIGTLPIVYFGNPEQKKKYLPRLATGEILSCYCLTETGSGSDALSLKTKATLAPDGKHYLLNGSKQFITNAGFSDLFIVYAKVDGDKFSAFIVEKAYSDGIQIGAEEKKLGLKGSSTCSITFENVKVPKENLLGEVGKGHKIAFNTLNIGRFKLGAGAMGPAKRQLAEAIKYGKVRVQFGKPIINFGLLRRKVADMTIRIYAGESMAYRIAGMMDAALKAVDQEDVQKQMDIIEEYAIEDSIIKVYGSETMSFVSDESLQMFGGYGFTEEYPAERPYRDCRVDRIFEGTNEINRMLIPGTLLRRASKGQLPLFDFIAKTNSELEEKSKSRIAKTSGPLAWAVRACELSKRVALYASNLAVQKYALAIQDEQEVMEAMANMIIDTYAMDSACARTLQLIEDRGKTKTKVQMDITNVLCQESYDRINMLARTVITSAAGDEAKKHFKNLEKLGTKGRIDTLKAKKDIAAHIVDADGYNLSAG